MASSTTTPEQAQLRQWVSRFMWTRSPSRAPLVQILGDIRHRGWRAFLFGGVLRDLMIHGSRARPRDVDIVVDGVSVADLASAFEPYIARRTRFGGLHLRLGGWMFDIWPLGETWALREGFVRSHGWGLAASTFLNVEAAAVEVNVKRGRLRPLYTHRFFEAFRARTVEINLEENPFPELCVVRSLITAARLDFRIGPRLAGYIESHARRLSIEQLLAVQAAHYGQVRASREELSSWLRAVCSQHQQRRSAPVELPIVRSRQLELWGDRFAAP
jgi:hypothetical protein